MRAVATWCLLSSAFLLSACGGGGGGGDGGGGGTAEASPNSARSIVSFSPSPVQANVAFGTSATLNVQASATDTSVFRGYVYAIVSDEAQVLAPSVELAPVNERTVMATLHTLPTLGAGRHQGVFQVHLCYDNRCSSEVVGSPVPLPYDIRVADGPLSAVPLGSTSLTIHQGELSISDLTKISVSGPSGNWLASAEDSWLSVSGGAGRSSGYFMVGISAASLTEGIYKSAVKISTDNGQTIEVPFSLEILPKQFALLSGVPSFSAVNGEPIASQDLSFEINNHVPTSWSASSSASWLQLSRTSGTVTPTSITLQPDPTRDNLASGVYTSDLKLSSSGVPDMVVSTRLTLSKASLSGPTAPTTFGGDKGRDTNTYVWPIRLNTGSNSWPYVMSGIPTWLTVTPQVGSINQDGAAISMKTNPDGVTPGSHTAVVAMTAKVNGDTVSFPFTLNINADQRRLLASEWSIALANSPAGALLTRSIKIRDGFAGALEWTATSDAPWLTVTTSGNTSGPSQLELRADSTSIPSDTVSYAKVTVRSETKGVEPAVIRVAVWNSPTGPAATRKLAMTYYQMVADKLRPYVYAHNGGSSIDVFNAYTAQKIGTISNLGSKLNYMAVSADGSRLYVLDDLNTGLLAVVDLDSWTKLATWKVQSNGVDFKKGILAMRTNGVDIVLLSNGYAYTDGRSLGNTGMEGPFTASYDGSKVYNFSSEYDVDYSEMSGGIVFAKRARFLNDSTGGNPQEITINRDGTRVYEAAGGGVVGMGYYNRCGVVDTGSGWLSSTLWVDTNPMYVEVTPDDKVICGTWGDASGLNRYKDFYLYSSKGELIRTFDVTNKNELVAGIAITPDGFIAVLRSLDQLLAFIPLEQ